MYIGTQFDWDSGNTDKCQKHGVSLVEIEALFADDPLIVEDDRHSIVEKRLLAIGLCRAGRMMFVGFTIRMHGARQMIRPVTARFMKEKEYLRYAGRTN